MRNLSDLPLLHGPGSRVVDSSTKIIHGCRVRVSIPHIRASKGDTRMMYGNTARISIPDIRVSN